MAIQNWDGKEWQLYCLRLLRARYIDHSLVEVPDRHQGDLGLEAFTHSGVGFQCYAAAEPLATDALYEKQRAKLTTDLAKLCSKPTEVGQLLGSVVLHRYVFMVPRHDSRKLVAHAQTKAAEVREKGLLYISEEFTITVETDEAYAAERDLLWSFPAPLVNDTPVDPEVAEHWASEHDALLADARRKLNDGGFHATRAAAMLDELLQQYLTGSNTLESIRERYPENWEAITSAQSKKEALLTLEYPPGEQSNHAMMRQIADELLGELMMVCPSLTSAQARTLAWSSVADWLMRCPLDFEVSDV